MYLQINTVKYDADREIMNIYENLQIVWSQFFTDMLLFVYIRSTSNIYWFISIRIRCQRIQMNTYLVTFDYLKYSVRYLMNTPKGKKTTIHGNLIYFISLLPDYFPEKFFQWTPCRVRPHRQTRPIKTFKITNYLND